MALTGTYVPSKQKWVRDQVAECQKKTDRQIPVFLLERA